MARCLSVGTMVIVLMLSSSAGAQTSERPGLADRFKSLFRRQEKPKTPAPPAARKKAKPPQNLPNQAVRVTTRSGSLRRPGPEMPAPRTGTPTPTFAPPDVAGNPLPPRRLDFSSARELPKPEMATPRPAFRDEAVAPANYETQPPKKTMASWLRGLWSREKAAPPGDTSPAVRPSAPPRRPGQSTSIDPRRVFRGPQGESGESQPASRSTRYSDFSETGVPRSTSEFQGRRDSAF